MNRSLLVAAGGGGDAIAATILHAALQPGGLPAHVATYAWERLLIDPLPGPRGPEWFTGLQPVGDCFEVTASSAARPPAGSTLPRLAATLPARLCLLDPAGGTLGLRRQLAELVATLGADRVQVVDVGGDIVAAGPEPGLHSPLADAMVLAAVAGLDTAAEVLVAGAGLDAELAEDAVRARCRLLGATVLLTLQPRHVRAYEPVWEWHPSEATGLLAAAVKGLRGVAEIRGDGLTVPLTEHAGEVYRLDPAAILAHSLIDQAVQGAGSLAEAEAAVVAVTGISEIDYERRKAARRPASQLQDAPDPATAWARLGAYEAAARARGVDYLTLRRIGEVLGLSAVGLERFRVDLRRLDPARYRPPLWCLQPSPALQERDRD